MAIIETGMNKYEKARAPDTLHSGGLGPCIAVGVINPFRGTIHGYMIHAQGISHYRFPGYDDFLLDVQREANQDMRIYITGGEVGEDADVNAVVLASRRQILADLKQRELFRFIKKIKWCPEHAIQQLELDLQTGQELIRTSMPTKITRNAHGRIINLVYS